MLRPRCCGPDRSAARWAARSGSRWTRCSRPGRSRSGASGRRASGPSGRERRGWGPLPAGKRAGLRPDAVVTVVGGGGLLCGVLQGLHAAGWTDAPVLAVETEGAASYAAALRAGRLVTLDRIRSIATTLGARTVAAEALAWAGR